MALRLRKAQGNRPGDWSDDDYDVTSGGQVVGRIYRRSGASDDTLPWFWSLLVIAPGLTTNGLAGTLDEAKAEFANAWQEWLASKPGKGERPTK